MIKIDEHTQYLHILLNNIEIYVESGEESIIVIEPCGAFDPVTASPMVPGLIEVTDVVLMSVDGTELIRETLDNLVNLRKYEIRAALPPAGITFLFVPCYIQ